jgi:hypothetical protein
LIYLPHFPTDRPIILCGLRILFNSSFYFLSYKAACNNTIKNYEKGIMVEKVLIICFKFMIQ